ncbi:ABC transporter permease [Dactylosporangium sp. AC04546]|uniref:ABC transporter permease n=1 Tax=Dactylosporangium sp. AC04546 TaxID=2862460 RepID=UPI001EDDECEB|nr:ABC transporter permease [Dactylosporangium sp. AC04546]WVK87902.1 ABC transporter permease [Dactylosporangium sp. AC04546]
MRRLVALGRAELLLLLRNRMALFNAAVLPIPLVAVTAGAVRDADPGFNARLVSGMLALVLVAVLYYNLVTTFVARREELVLKRLRTGELTDAEILLGTAGPSLVVALLQMVLFVAAAAAFLGLPVPVNAPVLVLGVLAGVAVFVALAAVSAAFTRTVELAQITTLPVLLVCFIGAGIAVPLSSLPDAVQEVLRFMPLTPAMELMRLGWTGPSFGGALRSSLAPAGLLAAWTVVAWLGVRRWFRWEPRR